MDLKQATGLLFMWEEKTFLLECVDNDCDFDIMKKCSPLWQVMLMWLSR